MTVRKRLYISNILMIVMPIVLTFCVLGALFLAFNESLGMDYYQRYEENEKFSKDYENIEKIQHSWQKNDSAATLKKQIAALAKKHPSQTTTTFVYNQQGKLIQQIGDYPPDQYIQEVLSATGPETLSRDSLLITKLSVGNFTVILANQKYHVMLEEELVDNKSLIIFVVVVCLIFMLTSIIATNILLARFIYKPIHQALDTLTEGVQHIRDGELTWRIDYQGEDEFTPVVNSFNEMAQRLQAMVAEQTKNSDNRKELIAGISHDLRTPLTAIKAYVEGLEQGVAQTPAMQQKYLKTIAQKTNDLNQLVNQLFLFSKIDIGEFPLYKTEVNIGEFLGNFEAELKEEYQNRGLHLNLSVTTLNSFVAIDVEQTRNVFINILENALKYGNKNDNQMLISQVAEDNQAIISFSDNGPGVPEDQLPQLFEVFYRGDKARTEPGQGSGLGLAIAKKIIEAQDGTISAKKVATGGLLMEIKLPLIMEEKDD